jgi:hypothetical protein
MIPAPKNIPPEIWAKIPPAPRVSVAILTVRGHVVTVRINRNGSPRYSVDGKREMDAATMSRVYKVE